MVEAHAVDRGRSVLPGTEERAFDSTAVSSTGATRQGSRDGGVPGLRALGHIEASTQATSSDCAEAIGERSQQRSAVLTDACTGSALHAAKCRHCPSHYRRA